jgi:ribulose kinase
MSSPRAPLTRLEEIFEQARREFLYKHQAKALTLTEINQKITWWQGERSRAVLLRMQGAITGQELKAHLKKYKMELTVLRRLRFETIKRMKKKLITK